MEVHHHPHLPHGKKRLKEYFLEFLMIFLAVTMGFIAENIREAISDHNKEREYISGMIENLAKDTTNIKVIIKRNAHQIKGLDSLRHIDKDHLTELNVQDSLLRFTGRYLFYVDNFRNDDITLAQLRSAGGYRLIKNNKVLDSIASYESRLKDINDEFTFVIGAFNKTRDQAALLFDLNNALQSLTHPGGKQLLITADKDKIYLYYNQCYALLIGLDGYYLMLKEHLNYTKGLIKMLKQEYGE